MRQTKLFLCFVQSNENWEATLLFEMQRYKGWDCCRLQGSWRTGLVGLTLHASRKSSPRRTLGCPRPLNPLRSGFLFSSSFMSSVHAQDFQLGWNHKTKRWIAVLRSEKRNRLRKGQTALGSSAVFEDRFGRCSEWSQIPNPCSGTRSCFPLCVSYTIDETMFIGLRNRPKYALGIVSLLAQTRSKKVAGSIWDQCLHSTRGTFPDAPLQIPENYFPKQTRISPRWPPNIIPIRIKSSLLIGPDKGNIFKSFPSGGLCSPLEPLNSHFIWENGTNPISPSCPLVLSWNTRCFWSPICLSHDSIASFAFTALDSVSQVGKA